MWTELLVKQLNRLLYQLREKIHYDQESMDGHYPKTYKTHNQIYLQKLNKSRDQLTIKIKTTSWMQN